MKAWILELCPEIAHWQAELLAEEVDKMVATEREACAKVADSFYQEIRQYTTYVPDIGSAIRYRDTP